MRVEGTSGWLVTEWCLDCDAIAVRGRAWISTRGVPNLMSLPIKEHDSVREEGRRLCVACGAMAMLECHHLAPRAQFGDACNLWPTVMVCRSCHEEWHRRMGQPIGNHSTTSNSSEAT